MSKLLEISTSEWLQAMTVIMALICFMRLLLWIEKSLSGTFTPSKVPISKREKPIRKCVKPCIARAYSLDVLNELVIGLGDKNGSVPLGQPFTELDAKGNRVYIQEVSGIYSSYSLKVDLGIKPDLDYMAIMGTRGKNKYLGFHWGKHVYCANEMTRRKL